MWATCNVGASLPEECGEYYAWGDIESKEIFKESNASTFGLKIGDISCNPAYDAARHNWGGLWRMPTASEVDELLRKCKWEKVRSKGSWCFCATGPNGNTIIFPLSGFKIGNSFIQKNEGAKYWSSTPNVSDSNVAYCWGFLDREYAMWNSKLVGNVIRPVIDKKDVNDMLVDNVQDSALPNLVVTVNGVKFSMTRVAGGTFTMGATKEQIGAREDECPSHRVTLSDYYIGTTEVTQELYMAVMGSNPSFFTGNSHYPVEQVSKSDCEEFIKRLNELTGENFSLPTEAQWEYAARGGNLSLYNLYSGSDSIDDVAWYSNNSLGCTHEVGSKRPNQLGIYDMSGNVFEWCEDNYNMYTSEEVSNPISHGGIFEVLRGGGWNSSKTNCRISYRNTAYKSVKHSYYGFRLALNQVKFLNIESK